MNKPDALIGLSGQTITGQIPPVFEIAHGSFRAACMRIHDQYKRYVGAPNHGRISPLAQIGIDGRAVVTIAFSFSSRVEAITSSRADALASASGNAAL